MTTRLHNTMMIVLATVGLAAIALAERPGAG